MTNKNTTQQINGTTNKGFAAMSPEKMEEIARKGGEASANKAGHDGMSERGRCGGEASAAKAGHNGMAARGQRGGEARSNSRSNGKYEDEEE